MSDETTEVLSVDEAMATGDPALMEKALAAHAGSQQDTSEQDEAQGSETASADDDAGGSGDTSGHDESGRPPIESKSGKHTIPYGALETERNERKAAEERAEDLQRQLDEANARISESEKQMQYAKQNLESRGVDMDEAFSDPDAITQAEVEATEEDYGKNSIEAKTARRLFAMQQQAATQSQQAADAKKSVEASEAEAAQAAFRANTDLTNWKTSDPAAWDKAVKFDEQLRADSKWQNATPAERFAEVVKRTKESLGADKNLKDRAKDIVDKTSPDVPDSLSDIGQKPSAEKSLIERLKDLSPAQLEAEMAKMSQSQIEEIMNSF